MTSRHKQPKTNDQDLMFDVTDLSDVAKAVVIDSSTEAIDEEDVEDSENCVLCGSALENVNDIDGLCNACINKIG